ncbi:MAG: isochorismatase family protein [Rhizobiaceae bacterium]
MRELVRLPADKAALVLVDLQEEHRGDLRLLAEGFDGVIARCVRLLEAARANGRPVFHFSYVIDPASAPPFHPVTDDGASAFSDKDDPLSALCPEVAPAPGETMFVKTQASAVRDGRLVAALAERGIEWIVVAGVWTEACIDATVRDAVSAGLRVMLVKDACASGTEAMHVMGVLNLANRLYGGAVVDTAKACAALAGEAVDAWRTQGAVPLRITFENAPALYQAL